MTVALQSSLLLTVGSLMLAYTLGLVPLPAWAAMWCPAFFPATVLFWALHQPQRFGVIAAWCCGLFLDATYATPLGQHGLALALAVFLVFKMRELLWALPPLQQAAGILPALLLYEFVLFWVDGVNGRPVDPLWRWLPALTTAAAWPLWSGLLERFALIEVKD